MHCQVVVPDRVAVESGKVQCSVQLDMALAAAVKRVVSREGWV